jgi:hypothetical protein
MLVKWIIEYAGKGVGHCADLETSLAASLVRAGKVKPVGTVEAVEPVKTVVKPRKPRK